MSTTEKDTEATADTATVDEAPQKLNLEVKIDCPNACQRHLTVTIAREDIDRYFDKSFSELVPDANVPGFRKGRAPRKLVEQKFRKEVSDQVKGNLLMDSISQVSDDEKLSAISEPDFDLDAIEVPDEGPMTFEFSIEVRPEFDLPQWKGLVLERKVREFTDADVDRQLEKILARYGRLVPHDGPAAAGDYVTVNLTFKDGETTISSSEEEVIRIKPVLSFRDGQIEGFDKLLAGVKAGETREGKATLGDDAPNIALRGKTVRAIFEVLDVKKLELPELTPQLLESLGDYESEADLRDAIRDSLKRQLTYHQQQNVRKQITDLLTESANWDLPQEMLKRQSRRELERSVMELRRSGFSDQDIRAHENQIRQTSAASTARSLKEHFILERVAEEEEIDAEPSDFDDEIKLIAYQSGESPRRVRARIDKGGMMDALRNQIVERKVIELIEKHAKVKEAPFELEDSNTEAIDQSAGGGDEADIPVAEHGEEARSLALPKDRS